MENSNDSEEIDTSSEMIKTIELTDDREIEYYEKETDVWDFEFENKKNYDLNFENTIMINSNNMKYTNSSKYSNSSQYTTDSNNTKNTKSTNKSKYTKTTINVCYTNNTNNVNNTNTTKNIKKDVCNLYLENSNDNNYIPYYRCYIKNDDLKNCPMIKGRECPTFRAKDFLCLINRESCDNLYNILLDFANFKDKKQAPSYL